MPRWSRSGNQWSPWRSIGGEIIGSPCLVDGRDGLLHLFVRGTSRRIFRRVLDTGGWSTRWENLGGVVLDSPPALAIPATMGRGPELHIFVTGASRRGFRKRSNGSRWLEGQTGWESLEAQLDWSF